MKNKPSDYIRKFGMQPHPEGGYYVRTYQSEIVMAKAVLPAAFSGDRFIATAIYYLLKEGDFSAFHRLKSDECWHFYAGGALRIFMIGSDGDLTKFILGNNILNDEIPQLVIRKDTWFAATPCENSIFSFVGCTVSPGFDFDDFELANGNELIDRFPEHKKIIEKFTR